jgi:hypothetical protein
MGAEICKAESRMMLPRRRYFSLREEARRLLHQVRPNLIAVLCLRLLEYLNHVDY